MKKHYNPFKMWGSYVGLQAGVLQSAGFNRQDIQYYDYKLRGIEN